MKEIIAIGDTIFGPGAEFIGTHPSLSLSR